MRTLNAIAAAGWSDAGLQREVNEDRFHVDEARGLFIVIDGVGGQAAGGKAADVALGMLRERLERETGPIAERVREAIAVANNEIYRLASSRPEWDGMACVLTIAVIKDGTATIGHVGDTRLYKLRAGRSRKSPGTIRRSANERMHRSFPSSKPCAIPVGTRCIATSGSEPHSPGDPEFVEIHEIPFDSDDALLLCSDGLSDLVDSGSILRTVREWAGDPRAVVCALVGAANSAGGKDNVTARVCRRRKLRGRAERISPEAGRIRCSGASFGQFHDTATWLRGCDRRDALHHRPGGVSRSQACPGCRTSRQGRCPRPTRWRRRSSRVNRSLPR